MAVKRGRHEFQVVIDGVELAPDVAERINAAVQKAALTELAAIDLQGNFRIRLPPFIPRPPRWGIWFDILSEEQLNKAGLEIAPEERGFG